MCKGSCTEVRGQTLGGQFSPPTLWVLRIKLGHQAWWQTLLTTEPSQWPKVCKSYYTTKCFHMMHRNPVSASLLLCAHHSFPFLDTGRFPYTRVMFIVWGGQASQWALLFLREWSRLKSACQVFTEENFRGDVFPVFQYSFNQGGSCLLH